MMPGIRKILYATDLSASNVMAYRWAMSLAERYGATVSIIHVLEHMPPQVQSWIEQQVPPSILKEFRSAGRDKIRNEVRERIEALCRSEAEDASLLEKHLGDIVVEFGQADKVILDTARQMQADAIVIGSHGHSTLNEILLGSTAHRLSQRSAIPVLLVRTPND